MKCLRVTMPNGERWVVPTTVIANDRAKYYAGREESPEDSDRVYEEEYEFAMEDDLEIYDWAPNNMNWVDVKEHATFIGPLALSDRDYQEGWVNGEKKIVELDIRV